MSFAFGSRSLQNLAGVHPDLHRVCNKALAITTVDFGVIEGRRTLDRQRELVASGASRTMNSRHLTGHAVDVMAYVGGQGRWDIGLYYQIAAAFQTAARELVVPMTWGGAWMRLDTSYEKPWDMVAEYVKLRRAMGKKPFIDAGHFELHWEAYP